MNVRFLFAFLEVKTRNGDVSPTIVPATGTMGAGKTSILGQSKRNHLK